MRKPIALRDQPRLSPSASRRTVPVVIKLTVEEARALAARAAAAGLPRAVYVRRTALGARVVASKVRAVDLRLVLALERQNRELRVLVARGVLDAAEVDLMISCNKKLHARLLCLALEDDR